MANTKRQSSLYLVACATAIIVLSLLGTSCDPRTFEDGFEEGGNLSDIWQLDAHQDCLMETSADKVREGDFALRIRALEGLRCELIPRIYPRLQTKFRREPFGDERWYKFSVFVEDLGESRIPNSLGDNTIVAQWHSSPDPFFRKERGRGPPLALRIYDGTWTEVWKNSELVMERKGANVFNDFRGVYLKLGLYHPTSDQIIFLDRVSITN